MGVIHGFFSPIFIPSPGRSSPSPNCTPLLLEVKFPNCTTLLWRVILAIGAILQATVEGDRTPHFFSKKETLAFGRS